MNLRDPFSRERERGGKKGHFRILSLYHDTSATSWRKYLVFHLLIRFSSSRQKK